jgi:hypothetical protein
MGLSWAAAPLRSRREMISIPAGTVLKEEEQRRWAALLSAGLHTVIVALDEVEVLRLAASLLEEWVAALDEEEAHLLVSLVAARDEEEAHLLVSLVAARDVAEVRRQAVPLSVGSVGGRRQEALLWVDSGAALDEEEVRHQAVL